MPFHKGEHMAQARMGVPKAGLWAPRSIRSFMPDQHRSFFEAQPFLAAAARDGEGRPWATLLAGRPGFAAAPSDRVLQVSATPAEGDALKNAFVAGADVGLLGLEFATRRRNRVNGRIEVAEEAGFRLSVRQSFGNCPQHIRPRSWRWSDDTADAPPVRRAAALTVADRAMVSAADTFFIASGYAEPAGDAASAGLDVSHRGGAPGFVQVISPTRLVFPDFGGNRFYNTVGNLMLDARIGLLFVDFPSGGLLQISGRAEIDWDSAALADAVRAERLIAVDIEDVVRLPQALPLRWTDLPSG